ncbi:Malonyl-CoA-acyl carrier protein transacylase, mitochondrial, partial [Trichinella britovi]
MPTLNFIVQCIFAVLTPIKYANSMSEKYRLLKLMNSLNTISWCSLRSSAAKKSSRYKQKQKFSHYWKDKNESWIHACHVSKLLSSSFIDKTPNDDSFCHEETNSDSLNFYEYETPSIFLFPGQNSEFVGMGRQVAEIVEVKEMFDVAEQVLGYNLLQLCLEGPVSKLRQTAFAQPAIFITSLAAAVESCVAAAGYSIGEYAALVFSGALDFESGSHIFFTFDQNKIHANATGLQRRLLWFDDCLFETKFQIGFSTPSSFKQGFENPICQVASSLYGQCKGLKFLEESSAEFNFKVRHLPVSGAFHTPLMEPVNGALRKAISMVQFRDPTIKVYSNVTGQPYKSADEIAQNLADQISKEAKWEQIMHAIYDRPKSVTKFPKTYEVGPGNQLGKILRRINKKAAAEYVNVGMELFSGAFHQLLEENDPKYPGYPSKWVNCASNLAFLHEHSEDCIFLPIHPTQPNKMCCYLEAIPVWQFLEFSSQSAFSMVFHQYSLKNTFLKKHRLFFASLLSTHTFQISILLSDMILVRFAVAVLFSPTAKSNDVQTGVGPTAIICKRRMIKDQSSCWNI